MGPAVNERPATFHGRVWVLNYEQWGQSLECDPCPLLNGHPIRQVVSFTRP
jgi:hypothetical protein